MRAMRLRARTELFLCARKSMLKSKDQRRQRWVFNGHSMIRMHAKRIKGGLELVYRNRPYEDTRGTRSPFRAQLARNADVRYPHKRLASLALSPSLFPSVFLSLARQIPERKQKYEEALPRGAGLPLRAASTQSHTPSVCTDTRAHRDRHLDEEEPRKLSRDAPSVCEPFESSRGSRRVRAGRAGGGTAG